MSSSKQPPPNPISKISKPSRCSSSGGIKKVSAYRAYSIPIHSSALARVAVAVNIPAPLGNHASVAVTRLLLSLRVLPTLRRCRCRHPLPGPMSTVLGRTKVLVGVDMGIVAREEIRGNERTSSSPEYSDHPDAVPCISMLMPLRALCLDYASRLTPSIEILISIGNPWEAGVTLPPLILLEYPLIFIGHSFVIMARSATSSLLEL